MKLEMMVLYSGDDEHFESCNDVNEMNEQDGINSDLREKLTGNENEDKNRQSRKRRRHKDGTNQSILV